MAFLDNSGDIILDAVLTDAGRQRMARGNFKIVKFAFGDEEINYNTFNASHPSGSAFYDLEVMQTPILESFTNNTSLMKSKLVTMTRNNILFMPIFKLNNNPNNYTGKAMADFSLGYILLADTKTEKNNTDRTFGLKSGFLRGQGTSAIGRDLTRQIAVDQGIDSNEGGISFRQPIPDDLVETAFLIRMDHRLLRLDAPLSTLAGSQPLTNQFIDDDGIASYYVVMGDGTVSVEGAPQNRGAARITFETARIRGDILTNEDDLSAVEHGEIFDGPLGSILRMYPRTSMHVQTGHQLFNELGSSGSSLGIGGGETIASYKYIDTLINIVGVTTGYSIDIPIRIVKGTF